MLKTYSDPLGQLKSTNIKFSFKKLFEPQFKSSSIKGKEMYIFGKNIKSDNLGNYESFIEDALNSCLWFTYRRDFRGLVDNKGNSLKTDCCTIISMGMCD